MAVDPNKPIPIVMTLDEAKAAFHAVTVILESAQSVPNNAPGKQEGVKLLLRTMYALAKYIDKAQGAKAI